MNWCIPAMILLLIIFAVGWLSTIVWALVLRKVLRSWRTAYSNLETTWAPRMFDNNELRRMMIWFQTFNPAMTRDEDTALINRINALLLGALTGDRTQMPTAEHMIPKPPTGEIPKKEKPPPKPKGEVNRNKTKAVAKAKVKAKPLEKQLEEEGWVCNQGSFGDDGEDLLGA